MAPSSPSPAPRLRLRDVWKAYAVPVLRGIDLDLNAGEVHGLVGANGAGKSTLSRIVCGLTAMDRGALYLDGQPYAPRTKAEAEAAGVHLVVQELSLVPTLTVAENLFLTHLPTRAGFVRYRKLHEQARRALEAVGLTGVAPDRPVGQLGVGEQQLVEIASVLQRRLRVLILDEPTAALTDPQVDLLAGHLERLRRDGVALLYISHRMDEVRRFCDRVTVLRDGAIVLTGASASVSVPELVHAMAGRAVEAASEHPPRTPGPVTLRVEGLRAGPRVREVSFEARAGEILGLAGLIGAGRTETLRALFGADPVAAGEVWLHGQRLDVRYPRDAVRAGLALIPESRKEDGLLLSQPVRSNVTLGRLDRFSKRGWVDAAAERQAAQEQCAALSVQYASAEQPARTLSGGNQQKVVIARWLLCGGDVFLFDEPTRGIDAAAKATIYRLLHDLAEAQKTLVVVSSDLDELMQLCDRIAVLSAGRLVHTFARGAWSRKAIMAAAFSEHLDA